MSLDPTPTPNWPTRIGFIALGFAVLVAIAGGVWAFINSPNDPSLARTGDCVTSAGTDANPVKRVDCHSSTATYQVVGVLNDVSDPGPRGDGWCQSAYAANDVEFWAGTLRQHGTVLCLRKLKP
jgi:hypothetical protein